MGSVADPGLAPAVPEQLGSGGLVDQRHHLGAVGVDGERQNFIFNGILHGFSSLTAGILVPTSIIQNPRLAKTAPAAAPAAQSRNMLHQAWRRAVYPRQLRPEPFATKEALHMSNSNCIGCPSPVSGQGTLRLRSFAARFSGPVPDVTVHITGDGLDMTVFTDADGIGPDIPVTAPAASYSLDENNTTVRPYATVDIQATSSGYYPLTIRGVQIFDGQITLANLDMDPRGRGRSPVRRPGRNSGTGALPVCGHQRQRPRAAHRLPAPGAGTAHHPRIHHGASGQALGQCSERHREFPVLHRQRGFQRGLPHLGRRSQTHEQKGRPGAQGHPDRPHEGGRLQDQPRRERGYSRQACT